MVDIRNLIEDSIATKKQVIESCLAEIQSSSDLLVKTAKENKNIFWCGNGGSAADSQHMASELMGGLRFHDRRPINLSHLQQIPPLLLLGRMIQAMMKYFQGN